MNYVMLMWILWAALGVVLLGLIMYRIALTKDEEDQLFLADANGMQHLQQDQMLAKLKRITPVIRLFGGVVGVLTLAIAAFYIMDALRQFS